MTEQQGSPQEPQGTPHEGTGPVGQPSPPGQPSQPAPAGQSGQPGQAGPWHQPEPPAWPPQQPPWRSGRGVDVARLVLILAALLGITNLFLGFTRVGSGLDQSLSFYDGIAFAWLPGLLFLGGLLAARAALVTADRRNAVLPLLVTAGTVIPFIFSVIKTDWGGDFPIGVTLLLIFGSLQLVATASAALVNDLQSGRIIVTKVPRTPGPGDS